MKKIVSQYNLDQKGKSVLDIGSMNCHPNRTVEATYRELFDNAEYIGLDLDSGPNVDVIATKAYKWPVADEAFDYIISGQCLEHVEAPWLWIEEVARICKKDGLAIIIAPWKWPEHKRPVDCWRILPDGMHFLLKYAGFDVLECGRSNRDCYGVGRKK